MATPCAKCGATSATSDYCDQCGARLDVPSFPPPAVAPSAPSAPTTPPAVGTPCPACGHPADDGATFCESCGCDLASGSLPDPVAAPPPVAADDTPRAWELAVSVDPAGWAEHDELHGPEPAPAEVVVPLVTSSVAIGRVSQSRGTVPDIDVVALTGDPAVSHRHCVLTRDAAGGWSVADDGSQNGTHMSGRPIVTATTIGDGAVVTVGAWTRLTLRARD